MPKLHRKRSILAKAESSYGTNPNPTGSANYVQVIDLNIDFNEKLNYIIDFALSILKEDTSNIHPVRLSDFIQELSNFRENLFEINSLNQRYSLHHLLLKIPC